MGDLRYLLVYKVRLDLLVSNNYYLFAVINLKKTLKLVYGFKR